MSPRRREAGCGRLNAALFPESTYVVCVLLPLPLFKRRKPGKTYLYPKSRLRSRNLLEARTDEEIELPAPLRATVEWADRGGDTPFPAERASLCSLHRFVPWNFEGERISRLFLSSRRSCESCGTMLTLAERIFMGALIKEGSQLCVRQRRGRRLLHQTGEST